MKLKDIKPGMIVAVGSPRGAYEPNGELIGYGVSKATVVAVGHFYKSHGYAQNLHKGTPETCRKAVLIGKEWNSFHSEGKIYPGIVPASNVLMLWEDYQNKLEEKKKKDQQEREKVKQQRKQKNQRIITINGELKKKGLACINPSYTNLSTFVELPLNVLESLLSITEV